MEYRKDPLVNGEIYHVYSRSIAGYNIFNTDSDYERMVDMFSIYRFSDFLYSYSKLKTLSIKFQNNLIANLIKENNLLVEIISFCLMPTHIHLALKQIKNGGISIFIGKVLNSYTRYFNIEHHRKGPLWEGRFKNVLVKDDVQLLHLTRYHHLNPVTAGIVAKPEDWKYSSYSVFLKEDDSNLITSYLDIKPGKYKQFVEGQIDYQKKLSKIKAIMIDNYSG